MSDATVERHRIAVDGGEIALVLHLPGGPAPVPAVLACHGLGASKDSEKYLLLGDALPRAGLALARFDFRGSGESAGLLERDTTIASRVADAEAALAFLAAHPRLAGGPLGLLGSSLGGYVALRAAAGRADGPPVVTWNAPSHLTDLANDDTRESAGLGIAFATEFMDGRYALSPTGVARHLVIHADADEVVDLEHGVVLHARASPPCDLRVIVGGDHRLSEPEHRAQALEWSLAWFREHFR